MNFDGYQGKLQLDSESGGDDDLSIFTLMSGIVPGKLRWFPQYEE